MKLRRFNIRCQWFLTFHGHQIISANYVQIHFKFGRQKKHVYFHLASQWCGVTLVSIEPRIVMCVQTKRMVYRKTWENWRVSFEIQIFHITMHWQCHLISINILVTGVKVPGSNHHLLNSHRDFYERYKATESNDADELCFWKMTVEDRFAKKRADLKLAYSFWWINTITNII